MGFVPATELCALLDKFPIIYDNAANTSMPYDIFDILNPSPHYNH
jgi:hypothetical protein